jgi:hypothetical protein
MFAWWGMFVSLLPALFYWFFARFPAPSPLDRRAPWLKFVLLAFGITLGVFMSGLGRVRGPAGRGVALRHAVGRHARRPAARGLGAARLQPDRAGARRSRRA